MKAMYERSTNYEGHARFMKILYFIEQEKGQIDLTEKKHNYEVSGKMARDRKLDPERMKEIMDEHMLKLDRDFLMLNGEDEGGSSTMNRKYEDDEEGIKTVR